MSFHIYNTTPTQDPPITYIFHIYIFTTIFHYMSFHIYNITPSLGPPITYILYQIFDQLATEVVDVKEEWVEF